MKTSGHYKSESRTIPPPCSRFLNRIEHEAEGPAGVLPINTDSSLIVLISSVVIFFFGRSRFLNCFSCKRFYPCLLWTIEHTLHSLVSRKQNNSITHSTWHFVECYNFSKSMYPNGIYSTERYMILMCNSFSMFAQHSQHLEHSPVTHSCARDSNL